MKVSCLLVGVWHRPEGLGFTGSLAGSVPASPQPWVPGRRCFVQSDSVACTFVVLVVGGGTVLVIKAVIFFFND